MTTRDRLKQLKRTIRYFCIKVLIRLMLRLPATSVVKLKRLMLKAFPWVFADQIRQAIKLLPDELRPKQDEIIRGMTENNVLTLLEVIFYEKLMSHDPDFVRIEGYEHLKAAIDKGKGVTILSAHFGNWELIGYTLARLGHPLHVVARPQAVNQMTELINSFREKRGSKVIMENNILESLKILRQKKVLGLVSDLNARDSGYQVKFFGRTASFYNVPVILARRAGASLIPTFAERQRDGRHIIRFEEPVQFKKGQTMQEQVQIYARRYEDAFRRRPDLWCWFHDRYSGAELGRT